MALKFTIIIITATTIIIIALVTIRIINSGKLTLIIIAHLPNNSQYSKMEDPLTLEYVVNFKQYAEYIKFKNSRSRHGPVDNVDDDEMRRLYSQYRENFQCKAVKAFFEEHKESEWFKEKYEPEISKILSSQSFSRKRMMLILNS